MVEWYCKFVSHSIVFLYFSLNIDIEKVLSISIIFKECKILPDKGKLPKERAYKSV